MDTHLILQEWKLIKSLNKVNFWLNNLLNKMKKQKSDFEEFLSQESDFFLFSLKIKLLTFSYQNLLKMSDFFL